MGSNPHRFLKIVGVNFKHFKIAKKVNGLPFFVD